MVEAQLKLGITDLTRTNTRKLQKAIENGVVIKTDEKKRKLDQAETI